jgi:nucleotide-binding universal stress UspA family protein
MKKQKTILAACDGSPNARKVVSVAACLTEKIDAHLILAHIIDERNVEAVKQAFGHLPHPEETEWIDYAQKLIHQANGELKALARLHRPNHPKIVYLVEIGDISERLLKIITDKRADIVVVGETHYHRSYGYLLGGTLHRLFRRCPVPLLSIRSGPGSDDSLKIKL